MEKNVKGQVQQANSGIGLEDWIRECINQEVFKGDKQVNITYGKGAGKRTIQEWEACFVFKPQAARGNNGVMLTELKGIADMKEMMRTFANEGFYQDTVFFPMGSPVNSLICNNLCCTAMIAKTWRYYENQQIDTKWGFIGTFNVMQFFFYNSSQAFVDGASKHKAVEYLGYLKNIFDKVLPKLLEQDSSLIQLLFGEANCQESHDVLHTCLSLAASKQFSPQDYRKINVTQIFEGLVRKSCQRMSKFSNLSYKTDFSRFTAHYTFNFFVPICMDFLLGKIASADACINQYLKLINDIKEDIRKFKLQNGIQQYRLIIARSPICNYISEDQAARIFAKELDCRDVRLPKEAYQQEQEEEIKLGEKRKRDEKEQEKHNPEKRQKQEEEEETKGPTLQFKSPFSLYSRSVNSVQTLKTTFGTNFGSIILPDEGYYTINLQSVHKAHFYQECQYKNDDHTVANFRIGFAEEKNQDYFNSRDQDSYSVSGVWFQSDKGKYVQMRPFKFINTQAIEFSVIFKDKQIYIEQDNLLFIKLKPSDFKYPFKLCLQGMNCIAVIQHSPAADEDIKRLEKIDLSVDKSCSICLGNAVNPHELKCEHVFCRDCISAWLKRNQVCPICRANV